MSYRYIVYILLCDESEYYVGITNDLARRLEQHRVQGSFFTKRHKSLKLVYQESFSTREQAAKRERQLKGWSHAKKTALINQDLQTLKKLSQRRRV